MSFFIRKRGGGGDRAHSSSGLLPTKLSESVGGRNKRAVGGGRGGGMRGGRGVKRAWDRGGGGGGRGRGRNTPGGRRGDDGGGERDTARGGGKRPKKAKGGDEEITSEEEEEDDDGEENRGGGAVRTGDRGEMLGSEDEEENDDEGENANETEQEARIRLAKEQIQMLRRRLENEKRSRRGGDDDDDDDEENDESATTDGIAKLLKTQVMEEQGKMLRNVLPQDFGGKSLSVQVIAKGGKALKSPLTSVITTPDSIFTATKSGDIARYKLADGTRTAHVTLKSTVTSLALASAGTSSSSSLFLCVATPSAIHLLDATTLATTQKLSNSRNSLSLAASGTSLFSTHKDRTVKVWDTGERAFVEALFGHQDVPTAVDVVPGGEVGEGAAAGGGERRIVTAGGFDRSLRVWKLDSESQLLFTWDEDVIDVVKVLSGGYFVAGGISGSLALFSFGRKRPLHVVKEAHGTQPQPTHHDCDHSLVTDNPPKVPRWITAVGGLGNLVASGSDDGTVKVWRVVARKLEHVRDISVGDGVVVSISVIMNTTTAEQNEDIPSSSSPTLVIGVSTEMRLGRWGGRTGKCSRIVVVK